MEIVVLKQAERELRQVPDDIRTDVFALFEDLLEGKNLAMPISRPLPSIAKGLHEMRLSGRQGEFRVFYIIRIGDAIYVLHVTHKKTRKTEKSTIETLKARIRSVGL